MSIPPNVKRELRALKKDARDAKRLRLPCDRCLTESSTGRCYALKHWVCDSCLHECCEAAP